MKQEYEWYMFRIKSRETRFTFRPTRSNLFRQGTTGANTRWALVLDWAVIYHGITLRILYNPACTYTHLQKPCIQARLSGVEGWHAGFHCCISIWLSVKALVGAGIPTPPAFLKFCVLWSRYIPQQSRALAKSMSFRRWPTAGECDWVFLHLLQGVRRRDGIELTTRLLLTASPRRLSRPRQTVSQPVLPISTVWAPTLTSTQVPPCDGSFCERQTCRRPGDSTTPSTIYCETAALGYRVIISLHLNHLLLNMLGSSTVETVMPIWILM